MPLELWMGAEIEEAIAADYRLLSKKLESKINEKLSTLSLPQANKWTFVATILAPRTASFYPDRSKFSKSRGTFEASVGIDYDSFLRGDHLTKIDLITKALLQSVGPMERAKVDPRTLDQIRAIVIFSAEEVKASMSSSH